jgi:hypothetical protein
MGIPDFACFWWLHHSHAHSTTHTTTNNHSFRPIPCLIQMSRRLLSLATRGNMKWMHVAMPPPYRSRRVVASVVRYVGCFSAVQNSTSNIGPVSWLCLEAGLSVMRLAVWAWNPTRDDAPPLEIILELDKYEHKPLPTCNKDNEDILEYKVLPLTRARDF